MKKFVSVIVAMVLVITTSIGTVHVMKRFESKPAGVVVKDGLSAYEIAVSYGYSGTVEEWLNSLNGKSAYEIAKENGYTGTKKEWTESLKATSATVATVTKAEFSASGNLVITLSDNTKINVGKAVGKDGENGKDGISVTSAAINENGQLVMTFSDGNIVNLDKVVGTNGEKGIGIEKTEISESGELKITYTDGNFVNLGKIAGIDGKNGENGTSISFAEINASGELVLSYSDGTTYNLGKIIGADGQVGEKGDKGDKGDTGAKGEKGDTGAKGEKGDTGVSVSSAEINTAGELVLTFSNNQKANVGKVLGANGQDGEKGDTGAKGDKGDAGIGIKKSEVNQKGELVITYTDNTISNLGAVVGAKGEKGEKGDTGAKGEKGDTGADGIGISSIKIENNELKISLTSGTTLNLGTVVGADGQDGEKGEKGEKGDTGAKGEKGDTGDNGIGVKSTEINASGELIITYTDESTTNLGTVIGAKGDKGDTGAKGEKGDAGAKGEKGDTGAKGEKGDTGDNGIGVKSTEINASGELVITYTDESTANLGTVIGVKGEKGDTGAKGEKGDTGADGVGISSAEIKSGELILHFSNSTEINLGNIMGAKGDKGDTGAKGEKGDAGAKGDKGDAGAKGEKGDAGAKGDKGDTGEKGEKGDAGAKGEKGDAGAKGEKGDTGAKGEKGNDGIGIDKVEISNAGELKVTLTDETVLNLGNIKSADGLGIKKSEINASGELVITYTDDTSVNLGNVKGTAGKDGKDGVGISTVTLSGGNLSVTLTSGTTVDLGNVKGDKGDTGLGIKSCAVNDKNHLIITYTDDTSTDCGAVVGSDGKDGVGVKTITLSDSGDFSITLTDNTVYNLGNIKGAKGDKGDTGAKGDKGDKGDTGAKGDKGEKGDAGLGIKSIAFNDAGELVITYTDDSTANLGNFSLNDDDTTNGVLAFTLLDDDTYSVSSGPEVATATSISIPATHNNKAVSTISEKAFSGLSKLETLTIPDSIVKIDDWAFSDCKALKTVEGCNGVVIYGDSVFEGDYNILSITISSSCEKIGAYCFANLSSTITINPTSLNFIGKGALGGATVIWDSDETTKWELAFDSLTSVYSSSSLDSSHSYSSSGTIFYFSATVNRTNADTKYKSTIEWARIEKCSNSNWTYKYIHNLYLRNCTWTKVDS